LAAGRARDFATLRAMNAYATAGWESFFVAEVGASAALVEIHR